MSQCDRSNVLVSQASTRYEDLAIIRIKKERRQRCNVVGPLEKDDVICLKSTVGSI